MQPTVLTVSDYLQLINSTLRTIPSEEIAIVGEIAEYRVSQGKWINIELKDEEEEAKISCFTTVFKVSMPLEVGMKIQATGYPKVYERFGKFSLNVETIELVGEGALAKAYELLKKKLAAEGLFDEARKRSIPRFPKKIGLITSKEAAAYGDFTRILNNRWGGVEVLHAPVHVQGKNAIPDILQAFEHFNALTEDEKPEVIVLTRGGGSLEDLHAFNDEQTARAVYQSSIPVVCGVGHERDESLCDFVADIRASTPSNAAETVVPSREEVLREIEMSSRRMQDVLRGEIDTRIRAVEHSVSVLQRFIEQKVHELKMTVERFQHAFERFRLSLVATRQYIERMEHDVSRTFLSTFSETKTRTHSLIRVFKNFDVQKTLDRGFSIVRSKKEIVRDVSKLAMGDAIRIQLARGETDATVGKQKQQTLL